MQKGDCKSMIPSKLQAQIEQQMQETRTQAILSACFSRINQNQETAAKAREDEKLRARYWWQERDK